MNRLLIVAGNWPASIEDPNPRRRKIRYSLFDLIEVPRLSTQLAGAVVKDDCVD